MNTLKKKSKFKHALYLILALAMLVYALPLISFQPGAGWISLFGAVWAGFAFLVIGAHLHFILGVNEDKQRALDAIRLEKYKEWQEKWLKEGKRGQSL
ncbi:hypothetical protein J2T12_000407 [Paenibacillus anaericanus]|uniref:Uncharacterized protein n=1 Tax=Paenibacillus anaericanus TaxID=170367 RepID=A0A433Y8B0_9BACL|nr:hypothetical protein [Paenibacillus anaericanus]MDQ0087013.1 hypothetical protein [Paenibacillus anaericanus]RUT46131.1 hypothetical protein EJP82_13490 [Paenibacillus anaericanus]